MSRFLKSTPFETTFDGDKVTCRFKAIKQADSLRLFSMRDDQGKLTRVILLPAYAEMLPAYVEEFKGLTSADGTQITIADVADHTYFTDLLFEMGQALTATGRLQDPKAPASQPGDTSAA